jgi:hypothetical protein
MARTEFGVERGEGCTCRTCRRNCMFMPGFLIPADFERMIPVDADPFTWAELNLLASPGTLVMKGGQIFRIPTLVSATKPDGSCIHYQKRRCAIWENSPFGCAFFGCGAKEEERLSHDGVFAVYVAQQDEQSLYHRIWQHLWDMDKRQDPIDEIRARMAETA